MKNPYDALRKMNAQFTTTSVDGVVFKDPKMIKIYFWYKGYNYIIDKDVQYMYDYTLNIFKQHSNLYKSDYKFFLNQLDKMVEYYPLLKNDDPLWYAVFALNIFCLTKLGFIKDDEFNGMQYVYE